MFDKWLFEHNNFDEFKGLYRYIPLKITLIYVLAGVLWILLSDMLLDIWVKTADMILILRTSKELAYVAVTAYFFYSIAAGYIKYIEKYDEIVDASEKNLKLLNERFSAIEAELNTNRALNKNLDDVVYTEDVEKVHEIRWPAAIVKEPLLICRRSPESAPNIDCNKSTATILIADDNEINRKVASAFVSKKGYNCLFASNGKEAVETVDKENIDLILMDIQMPELNGLEAAKIIRRKEENSERHIPIIAVTAYAMAVDRQKCIDAGMDDYIPKPFEVNELYEKIENYLGR